MHHPLPARPPWCEAVVRAMDEPRPTGPTEAEKARLVWKAAFPKAPRIADETAFHLGKKLARAVEWYRIAETNRPPRERERLENIERIAKKLARLLAESSGTRDRLEEFWPMYFGRRIDLQQARLGIASIRKTARRARIVETPTETVRRKGGGAALRTMFGSPQRLFILRVAAAYEEATGKKAKVSRNTLGELGGPFVRFTKEAATRFGLEKPSAETIKEALRRRKHG